MSDIISRQAAIDALERAKKNIHHNIERAIGDAICEILDEVENGVKQLPPIQLEIVRCKDCRHGVDYYHDGDCYCSNPKWGLKYFGGSWEFYCADAERRTDVKADKGASC